MSHSYSKQEQTAKNPKVHIDQYLYNPSEPRDEVSHYLPSDLEYDLLENSHTMRQHIRHIAQRLRNRYG